MTYSSQFLQTNEQNEQNGETALHTAVRTTDLKVVTVLSKHRADASIKNKKGETALTIAKDNNDADIIELLAPETQEVIRQRLASGGAQAADKPKYTVLKTGATAKDETIASDDDEATAPKKC